MFALLDTPEPTYSRIEGAWRNDAPYLTIHRLAGDGRTHGLFRCAADYCKAISRNVRADTHADNRTMQHLLEENGFLPCGTIHVRDGTPRLAYHWTADRRDLYAIHRLAAPSTPPYSTQKAQGA